MIREVKNETKVAFVKKSSLEQGTKLTVDYLGKYYGYFVDNNCIGIGCVKKLNFYMSEIKHIYILPEYRNNGIGRKLFSFLHEEAIKHSKIVTLSVASENMIMRRLVESFGYKEQCVFTNTKTGRLVVVYQFSCNNEFILKYW